MSLKADYALKECLNNEIKLIAFDIDGTLADSIEQIITCFKRTFERANLPIPDDEAIKGTIGLSLTVGIQSLLPDPTDEKLALEVTQLCYDIVSVSPDLTRTNLFPEVKAMLATLHERGYQMAIATGKYRPAVDNMFKQLPELKPYFKYICTGDTCESKPSPMMITEISALSGTPMKNILGIGDSILDIQMFRNAKCHEMGVLTGVSDFYTLDDFDTEFILPKVTDLLQYLA